MDWVGSIKIAIARKYSHKAHLGYRYFAIPLHIKDISSRMSFIKQKRQQFVTALEKARHNSSSSLDEFNTSLSCMSSVDSIDAFSDPFSSELSECGSILNEENLADLFLPTEWSSSTTALDTLPGYLELNEIEYRHSEEDGWPLHTEHDFNLSCGGDDFLTTAEDTAEMLSRLASENSSDITGQIDFLDIIDDRQCNFSQPDSAIHGSKYRDLFDDIGSFESYTTDNQIKRSRVLKEDPWLCNGSANGLAEIPQLSNITVSPGNVTTIYATSATQCVSTKNKRKSAYQVKLADREDVENKSRKAKRLKAKKNKLTPNDILIRKEKNRLRSKAYRERRKLQLESLKEQVILAKLEADIAQQQMKMSKRH